MDRSTVVWCERVEDIVKSIARNEGIIDCEVRVASGSTADSNYVTDVARVTVTGTKNGNPHRMPLIVKLSLDSENYVHTAPMFENEINAFEKILPAMQIFQKNCLPAGEQFTYPRYYGSSNGDPKYVILEDLNERGYKTLDKRTQLDTEHVSAVVKVLARFHATSFVLRRNNPDLYAEFAALVSARGGCDDPPQDIQKRVKEDMLAAITDDDAREKLKHFLKECTMNCEKYLNSEIAAPYNVIVHADCWTTNFMFKYEGDQVSDAMLIDWQTLRIASPLVDLVATLFLCTSHEVRNRHMVDLFDMYYQVLASNVTRMGSNIEYCYPETAYREHLKMIMPLGIVSVMVYQPLVFLESKEKPHPFMEEEEWFSLPHSETFKQRLNDTLKTYVEKNLF